MHPSLPRFPRRGGRCPRLSRLSRIDRMMFPNLRRLASGLLRKTVGGDRTSPGWTLILRVGSGTENIELLY